MNAILSFREIFDKTTGSDYPDSWDVPEFDSKAKLKILHILNEGNEFKTIDNLAYKGLKDITELRSSLLMDKDCDGVALTQIDGKKFLILSELKSNLSTIQIDGAYNQIIYTFLKLCMMFSICQDYDIEKYNIIGIIACQPPSCERQKEKFNEWANLLDMGGKTLKKDIEFCAKLYSQKCMHIKMEEAYMLKDKKLIDKIKNKKLHLYFVMAENYLDTEVSINLKDLLRLS